jgi:fibronectin-binding autotransporter adhesin
MLTHRHPNRFLMIAAIAAVLTVLSHASPARAQDAYFSLEGQFQNVTDTQSFLFGLTNSVGSAETLHFNTWSHFGGTNAAGDGVAGGGFDPVLSLFDGDGAAYGANDDGYIIDPLNPNRDAYLTWLTQAPNPAATGITTDPLPSDGYEVKLSAFGGTFPSPWATDLVAPAAKMVMTGLSATGGSTVDSLKFGTTGPGASSAVMNIAQLDTLNIANSLYVGNTGKGTLTSFGTVNSGFSVLGSDAGSEGSVTLTASGNWLGSTDVRIGSAGTGTLLIQGGAVGSFQGNAYLAYFGAGQGGVTVRDNGSLMFVAGDLEVGDGGVGTLNIQGGGWVNSSGVGSLSRDVIGDDPASNGTATVTGSNSLWDTDRLVVANNGDGTLRIEAGGRVNSASAEIGVTTLSANGDATVTGANSLWNIAGNLDVGTTQISLFSNAALTIENGGAVQVAGATTVNDTGKINLTGSTLKTGTLSAASPTNFNWTAGTLELTNSDVTLDSFFPDSVLGSTPTIGTGKALILSNNTGLGDLFVAKTGSASLTINGGGDVTANQVYVAYNSPGNADLNVTGVGSTLTVYGDLEVGDGGQGSMNVLSGGTVDSSTAGLIGRDVIGNDTSSFGTAVVSGAGSRWLTDDLIVGDSGTGTLHITVGGNVASQNVLIGQNNTGTVNVDGLGSLWQLGTLTVGSGPGGPGNVNLTNQAQIQSGSVTVGTDASNGNVTINGFVPGFGLRATWDVTGSMTLGSPGLGRGAVTVENAGLLNVSDSIDVTGSVDAAPSLTVRTNGEVNVANNLNIGKSGSVNLQDAGSRIQTGTFTANSGGAFNWTAGTLEISASELHLDSVNPDSVFGNALTVGAGMRLITSNPNLSAALDIGQVGSGVGSLTIVDGGTVDSFFVNLGEGNTTTGTALVSGLGSRWDILTDLRVGDRDSANGQLQIQNQAIVTAGYLMLGRDGTAHGELSVDGNGSQLTVNQRLDVGGGLTGGVWAAGGTGSLTVSNGGVVDVGSILRVWPGGTVNLLGSEINTHSFDAEPGSTVNHDDGTLIVDGGTFDPGVSNYTLDGAAPADLPVVQLINGASASLLGGSVTVGVTNRGRLEILSGSSVVLPEGELDISNGTGGSGEVVVDGQGSGLTTEAGLIVGGSGNGILRVRNGASVFDPASPFEPIAWRSNSTGLAEVVGAAPNGTPSTWTTNGILEVGLGGVGTLTIAGGGRVNALASATIAEAATTSSGSSATVDGSGPLGPSTWDITGSLYVGGDDGTVGSGGVGTLTVSNGGKVNASSNLHVWNTGSANVDPASRIDIGTGAGLAGKVNVLTNGTLSGSGQINADVFNDGGTVAPGASPGTLTITGDYDQTPAGRLEIELGGTAASLYDELNPTGLANLAGELALTIDSLFTPPIGNRFDIINTGLGVFGRFDSVLFPNIVAFPSRGLGLIYGSNTVSVSSALMGDLNFDGFVGIADLNIVLGNWNQNVDAGVWSFGDPSGDGFIGIEDLNTVLGNWNATWNASTPPEDRASATVPEPGTAVMLLLAAAPMLRRRGAKRQSGL